MLRVLGRRWAVVAASYLDGGLELGAMIVDQRFLPSIVEGEVHCNMIGDQLVTLVHKIPQEGSVSATLQSGAVYHMYTPQDPEFASLLLALSNNLPLIMESLNLGDEPLLLLWTISFLTLAPMVETFFTWANSTACALVLPKIWSFVERLQRLPWRAASQFNDSWLWPAQARSNTQLLFVSQHVIQDPCIITNNHNTRIETEQGDSFQIAI